MHILRSSLAYSLRGVGSASRRPRHRILRFEKFFDIKKGQPFVMPWLPRRGGYPWHLYQQSWRNCKNWSQKPWSKHWSYAFLTIIPWFQHSNIPSFHVGDIKPVPLKTTWFQYIIEIPRRSIKKIGPFLKISEEQLLCYGGCRWVHWVWDLSRSLPDGGYNYWGWYGCHQPEPLHRLRPVCNYLSHRGRAAGEKVRKRTIPATKI